MSTRNAVPHLIMVLKRDESYGSVRLNAEVCYRNMPGKTFNPTHDTGTVLNPQFEPWSDNPYGQFQNLQVTALLDTDSTLNDGRSYGWEYSYHNVFDVNLDFAQQIVKTLRRLNSAMSKLRAERGTPNTFAEYLTHFANAIGCTRFAEYSKELRADGTHWVWMDIDQMHAWVRKHERHNHT